MSAISFLAGLGAGYLGRQDQDRETARRDKLDQITFDRAAAEKADREQALSDRQDVRAAAAPLPVAMSTDQPDNIDVGQPGETVPQPVYRVGAQRFASQGAAETAANDPTAQSARVQQALGRQDPLKAQQFKTATLQGQSAEEALKASIRHAQDEGTGRALNMALSLGPAGADKVKEAYNASGKEQIADLQIIPIEVNHPVLGPQKSVRMVGKTADGQSFEIPDALDASFKLFSAEKQFEMLTKAKTEETKGKREDRKLTMEEGAAGALARYHDAMATAAGVRADKTGSGGKKVDLEDRMSEPDKEEYRGIKDQIKTINAEITKAQAADSYNAESDNAKRLATRLSTLNLRGRGILDRYAATDDEAPDPAGIRRPAATRPQTSMELVRADMAKNGVKDATFDDKGQQIVFGKGGGAATPAGQAAQGVQAPAAPPAVQPGMQPTADKTLNGIQAQNMAAMQPLNAAVTQAKAMLANAAKSGDPTALAKYAQALAQARAARDQAAQQAFGNSAPKYLASVDQ